MAFTPQQTYREVSPLTPTGLRWRGHHWTSDPKPESQLRRGAVQLLLEPCEDSGFETSSG